MLGPDQLKPYDVGGYRVEDQHPDWSEHKRVFVKRYLKAFNMVADMKEVFSNVGVEMVVEDLGKSYDGLCQTGTDDINYLSILQTLHHFVGMRLQFPVGLTEEAKKLAKWVKEHINNKPEEVQDVGQGSDDHLTE